jgi:hypothetical protein
MAKLQEHHITYNPEWTVELSAQMHKVITTIQITKASPEQYARLVNFQHALSHELNRMRQELDTGLDLRTKKPKTNKEK